MAEDDNAFGPIHPPPRNWPEVRAITQGLVGISIDEIDRCSRIDAEYDMGSKDMQPCGRSGCEQKHGHGYILALAGRRYVHIGVICARKYAHAATWAQKESAFEARRLEDARRQAQLDAADRAQRALYWLDNTPELGQAIGLCRQFEEQARGPLLDELVERAHRRNYRVERQTRLSREDRDLRRDTGSYIDSGGVLRRQRVAAAEVGSVLEIQGLACLSYGTSPNTLRVDLQRLATTINVARPAIGDRQAIQELRDSIDALGRTWNLLTSSLADTRRFFAPANLRRLMSLEVMRRQGIEAITREGPDRVVITRKPHWNTRR